MTPVSACRLGLLAGVFAVAPTHLRGEIRILAVTAASGYAPGLPSPGSLGTIFCTGLADISGVIQPDGPQLPRELAGVRVEIGGTPAPILAVADLVGYQQVNFQVPWETAASSVAIVQGSARAEVTVPASTLWSVFFLDPAGNLIAQHATDYRLVTKDNPARPGEWITVYASNLGPVENPPPSGAPTPLDRLYPLMPGRDSYSLQTSVGGASTNFMGLAPGMVGVFQINFQVPDLPAMTELEVRVQKVRWCGFFWDPACGRGLYLTFSENGRLPAVSP